MERFLQMPVLHRLGRWLAAFGTASAMTLESPQGIDNGTAFGIIGAGGVLLVILLVLL